MSVIGPVQSHYHEGSPVGKRSLRWEGFVEKVGFEPGVKEWWIMRAGMTEMGWQVGEEVNRDKTGEVDEMNLEVDCVAEGLREKVRSTCFYYFALEHDMFYSVC